MTFWSPESEIRVEIDVKKGTVRVDRVLILRVRGRLLRVYILNIEVRPVERV